MEMGWGLDVVLSLQASRNEFLEILVTVLNFMGEELFFVAIIALVYWSFSKRVGTRALIALVVISLAVFIFKDLLGRPRPFQVSQLVQPVFEAEGFGIPSGHTAVALTLWGYLAFVIRKAWVTVLVVLYVMAQGLGRMIAGVHFPQDIIAGLILGSVILALYIPLADRAMALWKQRSLWQQVAVALIFAALGLLIFPDSEANLTVVGLLVGGCLGIAFESRFVQFKIHEALARRAIQYLLGLALSIALLLGLDVLFGEAEPAHILRLIRYASVAIFALTIWPYLSIQAGLMHAEPHKSVPQAA